MLSEFAFEAKLGFEGVQEEEMSYKKLLLEEIDDFFRSSLHKNEFGTYQLLSLLKQHRNDKQALILGLNNSKEILGKTLYDLLLDEKEAKLVTEYDQEIITSGISQEVEEPLRFQNQDYVFLSQKSPLKSSDGEILGMVGVSIDITRQKELESHLYVQTQELQDALTEKQRFLNNLSHEIRTPLHVIKVIADELFESFDELPKTEVQSFLKTLVENNNRLMKLLTNLLDIAKGAQKKDFLNLEAVDIIYLVQSCIDEVKQTASISFQTNKKEITLQCDEIKISQVAFNRINKTHNLIIFMMHLF